MRPSVKRHIGKTISYRILGTLATTGIGYLLTGDYKIASMLGTMELIVKPIIYFAHERIWYKYINFGLRKDRNTN